MPQPPATASLTRRSFTHTSEQLPLSDWHVILRGRQCRRAGHGHGVTGRREIPVSGARAQHIPLVVEVFVTSPAYPGKLNPVNCFLLPRRTADTTLVVLVVVVSSR